MVETKYTIQNSPRIALLADFHNGNPDPILSSLKRHEQSLDLIAIAGDLIYGSQPEDDVSPLDRQKNILPLLASCAELAPTYLSLGNHEWCLLPDDLDRISSNGVVVLDNSYVNTTINGSAVIIGGLTSAQVLSYRQFLSSLPPSEQALCRYPRRESGEALTRRRGRSGRDAGERSKARSRARQEPMPSISWLDSFSHTRGFRILLSHHPEYYDLIPSCDLVLCGHTHAGQWKCKIGGRWIGLFAPGQGFFPRYCYGRYDNMIISSGLTNTTWVPRVNNPTEIVYINV